MSIRGEGRNAMITNKKKNLPYMINAWCLLYPVNCMELSLQFFNLCGTIKNS